MERPKIPRSENVSFLHGEGSKIQEEAAKGAAHLKIVSVDAPDQRLQILDASSLDRFEIKEEDIVQKIWLIFEMKDR